MADWMKPISRQANVAIPSVAYTNELDSRRPISEVLASDVLPNFLPVAGPLGRLALGAQLVSRAGDAEAAKGLPIGRSLLRALEGNFVDGTGNLVVDIHSHPDIDAKFIAPQRGLSSQEFRDLLNFTKGSDLHTVEPNLPGFRSSGEGSDLWTLKRAHGGHVKSPLQQCVC